jgi:hypothetical protein
MSKISSMGAGFGYKGDPAILIAFIDDLKKRCEEKDIKLQCGPLFTVETGGIL